MKQNISIQIFRETAKNVRFYVVDDYGNPVNLTAATGLFKVYLDEPGQTDTFVINKSLSITNTVMGICQVNLLETDTNIDEYNYKYILEFDFGDGEARVLSFGAFEIVGDDNTRISQIKEKYTLEYDYYTMREALNYARKELLQNGFIKEECILSQKNSQFLIDNYVMDMNFDYLVTADDIDIIEFQQSSPYGINDLNSNISSVNFNHPNGKTIINMDAEYPNDTYTLKITYYRGNDSYNNIVLNVKQLEEWYALYHIFKILPIYKLQRGLPSRTINGVTIDFSQESIDKLRQQIFNWIQNEIMKFRDFGIERIQINKRYA